MEQIKELMLQAINEKPNPMIKNYLLDIWNMPFFFKIDKAKAITISYCATDTGSKNEYNDKLIAYRNGKLTSEDIFNIQYNWYNELSWRWKFNLIFRQLEISPKDIAHMDISIFPYFSDYKYFMNFRQIDKTYYYLLKVIELLNDLKYIFIDGKENINIVNEFFKNDFILVKEKMLQINSGQKYFNLQVFKHRTKEQWLIYYGCLLHGGSRPSNEKLEIIGREIHKIVLDYGVFNR